MATVVDHLVISLGLDPRPLQSGLNQVKSLAMRFAGPIAGAFSIHKVFQNYVESVSWVAKVTGGYFEKLENYKYKMAMLARVTREDIEVYRKYREALVKFNITMGDLSMKIMREFYPVFRTMIDGLNNFSDWVDRNHDNIIRFLEVAAGVIATALTPAIIRMTAALLANPLTWFIAMLAMIILLLDDFVTYMQGGKSEFEDFWKKLGTPEELKEKLGGVIEFITEKLAFLKENLFAIGFGAVAIMSIGGAFVTLSKVVDTVTKGANGLYAAFNLLRNHPIIALLTLGTIAVGAWIANFDAIKQGFHDLINDMSEYFNNSTFGKWYNATIKPAGEFVDKLTGAIGDTLGVGGQKLFGNNPNPTAPATKLNEYRKKYNELITELKAENRILKMLGKPLKHIPTFDEFYNVQVPADKVVGGPTGAKWDSFAQTFKATTEKKDGKPRDGFSSAPSLEGVFASLDVAAKNLKNFSSVPLVPAGATAGWAKGNVTVGSHNNTTVNNYVEVKVEGTNATAEDIGQATAQATTQATVDASDKGTFQ